MSINIWSWLRVLLLLKLTYLWRIHTNDVWISPFHYNVTHLILWNQLINCFHNQLKTFCWKWPFSKLPRLKTCFGEKHIWKAISWICIILLQCAFSQLQEHLKNIEFDWYLWWLWSPLVEHSSLEQLKIKMNTFLLKINWHVIILYFSDMQFGYWWRNPSHLIRKVEERWLVYSHKHFKLLCIAK